MLKKLFAVMFTIVLLIQPMYVFADESPYDNEAYGDSQEETAEQRIIDALESYEKTVDISDCGIAKEAVGDIVSNIIEENAQLFYVNKSYSVTYEQETDNIISITFSFKYEDSLLDIKVNDFNSRVNMILDEIEDNGDELEIIHSFHDYIVENYNYDETLDNSDAYEMLVTGKGTCMAYTALYGYLLRQYGIESTVVKSKEINHIWNAVMLNGEYYNVDVTWDDPIGGSVFSTSHKYLMKSDEYFENNDHPGRSSEVDCTSKLYDDYRWGDETILSRVANADEFAELMVDFFPYFCVLVIAAIFIIVLTSIGLRSNKKRRQNDDSFPPDCF